MLRRVLVQKLQGPLQGMQHRLLAHGAAITGEVAGFGQQQRLVRAGRPAQAPAEADGADRLVGRAAIGAGNAGHGHREQHIGTAERATGHLDGHRLADGAPGGQGGGIHTQHVDLGLVGIGDITAAEPGAGACRFGERGSDQTAGAGFCRGNQPTLQAGHALAQQARPVDAFLLRIREAFGGLRGLKHAPVPPGLSRTAGSRWP